MAANTAPIYPHTVRSPGVSITSTTTALVRTDGVGTIGTDLLLLSTAGTDGTFYRQVNIKPCATTAATNTTATVIRVFKSTVTSGATTAGNTQLLGEVQIPSVSAANTTIPLPDFIIPLNIALEAGHTLLIATSVATGASVTFACVAIAGDY